LLDFVKTEIVDKEYCLNRDGLLTDRSKILVIERAKYKYLFLGN